MNNIALYIEQHSEDIDKIENRYNFLPKHDTAENQSMDKICLSKTIAIAKNKEKEQETKSLEETLRKSRDYATKKI